MKLFIASDIHGSAYYCKKMLECFEKEGADRMLLLGDLLYHGPRNDLPRDYSPKEVIPMLNAYKDKILAVRGNCDADIDQVVLDFPIMAEYSYIALEDRVIYATHGHIYSYDNIPPLKEGDIFIQGHTHVPVDYVKDGIRFLNPGSVSIPKEESGHGYIIFDGKDFVRKTFE
ncbi:MAG: phosphodiesterase [Lachnospiraceae bacterium]|nr:phosphodiesterase [Lachnospiraceae bacterium]